MRISDWSSDVCSSDLVDELECGLVEDLGILATAHDRQITPARPPAALRLEIDARISDLVEFGREAAFELDRGDLAIVRKLRGDAARADEAALVDQIGRAACRESVCQ